MFDENACDANMAKTKLINMPAMGTPYSRLIDFCITQLSAGE